MFHGRAKFQTHENIVQIKRNDVCLKKKDWVMAQTVYFSHCITHCRTAYNFPLFSIWAIFSVPIHFIFAMWSNSIRPNDCRPNYVAIFLVSTDSLFLEKTRILDVFLSLLLDDFYLRFLFVEEKKLRVLIATKAANTFMSQMSQNKY